MKKHNYQKIMLLIIFILIVILIIVKSIYNPKIKKYASVACYPGPRLLTKTEYTIHFEDDKAIWITSHEWSKDKISNLSRENIDKHIADIKNYNLQGKFPRYYYTDSENMTLSSISFKDMSEIEIENDIYFYKYYSFKNKSEAIKHMENGFNYKCH